MISIAPFFHQKFGVLFIYKYDVYSLYEAIGKKKEERVHYFDSAVSTNFNRVVRVEPFILLDL